MKSRQELLEQQKKLLKMHKKVEQQLMKIPGVSGVGVGIKESRFKVTEDMAFRIYVDKKMDKDDLPPEYIIPPTIRGVKTDVLAKSRGEPICSEGRIRPLVGGIQITKISNIPGTLGCMATLNDDSGTTVLLSNEHVLYAGVSLDGETVFQPEHKTFLSFPCNEIGSTVDRKEGDVEFNGKTFFVDCAIAKINVEFRNRMRNVPKVDGSIVIPSEIVGVAEAVAGTQVRKVGAKSGLTIGIIMDVLFPQEVVNPFGEIVTRQNQILVKPSSEYIDPSSGTVVLFPGHIDSVNEIKTFVDKGDSGSVLMDDHNQVVGLLWFRPLKEGVPTGEGTACHIHPVLKAMNITINTTNSISPAPNPGPTSPEFISRGAPILVHHAEADRVEAPVVEAGLSDRSLLQEYEQEFLQTAKGRAFLEAIKENREEVLNLVNHNRRVMVTWRRKQGPAFLAAFARTGEEPSYRVPQEINGISIQTLLRNMAVVLEEHGSRRLQQAIRGYALEVFNIIQESDSLKTLLEKIKRQWRWRQGNTAVRQYNRGVKG